MLLAVHGVHPAFCCPDWLLHMCPVCTFGGWSLLIGRSSKSAHPGPTGARKYTQGGSGARLELLVLHDDAERDFAYGPARGLPSDPLVHFTPELDEYAKSGGIVVSTKNDWNRIFAFEGAK